MLIHFALSNHRSIRDRAELSMIAIDDRAAVRRPEGFNQPVLTTAGIYGANASGKSNVLSALGWVSKAVRTSLRSWDEHIPRDPHRFGGGRGSPSSFELGLVVEKVRYLYKVSVDDTHVISEELRSYPKGRPRLLFSRVGETVDFRRGLAGARAVRELLGPTTLLLSAAQRVGNPELRSVARFISSMTHVEQGHRLFADELLRAWNDGRGERTSTLDLIDTPDPFPNQESLFADGDDESSNDLVLALLRFADPTIRSVGLQDVAPADNPWIPGDMRLTFSHNANPDQPSIGFDEESAGTRTWFALIGPALGTLRLGGVLLLDEIDASLHPLLATRLLELFREPETNPRGAQLIFTGHDVLVLSQLNRDELWLTDKDTDGSTRLTPVSDFKSDMVRRFRPLHRAYLAGRFGAIPDLPLRSPPIHPVAEAQG